MANIVNQALLFPFPSMKLNVHPLVLSSSIINNSILLTNVILLTMQFNANSFSIPLLLSSAEMALLALTILMFHADAQGMVVQVSANNFWEHQPMLMPKPLLSHFFSSLIATHWIELTGGPREINVVCQQVITHG